MTGLEVLNSELNLADQWQLGSGGRLVWAPAKPRQHDRPGFRDPATFDGYCVQPVFAIALLDRTGREIPVVASERRWTPARLELEYRLPEALIKERRTSLSNETLLSEWTMSHAASTSQRFWLALWTRRPDSQAVSEIEANPQGISFQDSVYAPSGEELARWGCAMGASFDADSWSVDAASASTDDLRWEDTPFYELMAPGGLPGHVPANEHAPGSLYLALAYPFEIPPGERLVVSFAASFGSDVEQARRYLERSVSMIHPIHYSEEEWINWFEEAPEFACSDPYLQRLYWNRWAQRRLFPIGRTGCESFDEFDSPIGRGHAQPAPDALDLSSAVVESAWQNNTEFAWEELRALLNHSEAALQSVPVAHAVRRVQTLHPDPELQRGVKLRLREIAETWGSDEPLAFATFQEPWSQSNSGMRPSLKESLLRLDVLRQLSHSFPDDDKWHTAAATLTERINREFWDSEQNFYVQPVADRSERRPAKTADGFLALLALDLPDNRKRAILETLHDPECFWTKIPLPSLSRDDVDFSAEGHWQSQRCAVPRHGRVWLGDCSLILDSLGKGIEHAGNMERILFAELLQKLVRAHYLDGDLDRPAVYDHYNPLNGKPSAHLGRAAAPAGWMIDHILRFVAGVRPLDDGRLLIDPLPFDLEWFSVRNLVIGEHELEIDWDQRSGLSVRIDEEPVGRVAVGQSLTISLPEPWAVR